MTKLVAISAFVVVAFTAQSAAACDWNRQASTEQQTAAAAPAPQTRAAPAPSQTLTAAAEVTRKPVEEVAPVVLVSDHR